MYSRLTQWNKGFLLCVYTNYNHNVTRQAKADCRYRWLWPDSGLISTEQEQMPYTMWECVPPFSTYNVCSIQSAYNVNNSRCACWWSQMSDWRSTPCSKSGCALFRLGMAWKCSPTQSFIEGDNIEKTAQHSKRPQRQCPNQISYCSLPWLIKESQASEQVFCDCLAAHNIFGGL